MDKATQQKKETPKRAPAPRKVSGPSKLPAGQAEVPNLFPQWVFWESRSRQDQFEYIKVRMIELALEKSLSVTDLHRQPKPIPDYAGMIILGQEYGAENEMVMTPYVPMELADYRVRILSRDRIIVKVDSLDKDAKRTEEKIKESISWKIGREPAGFFSVARGGGKGGACQVYRDTYMEFGEDVHDYTFNLPTAWRILHQAGAHCVKAARKDKQERLWKYEEVMPEVKPSSGEGTPIEDAGVEPHMRKRGVS
tara:strand:- start:1468 stop:2223 length:756 start_codon:yes stop_codon:yes gene_type:complete